MERSEARIFCEQWLPLWTGNRPRELADLYTEDAFYRDPAVPEGISGKPGLLRYFEKLCAFSPRWVWKVDDIFPIDGGFVLRWKAEIPIGTEILKERGMDLVLVDNGRISRNEVYFDRSRLMEALKRTVKS